MDSAGGAEGASQRPWNASDRTLGHNGCGSLQNMAGAKVSNVFGSCFDKCTAES